MAGEEVDERQKLCGLKPLAEMSAYDGHIEEESFVGWDVLAGAVVAMACTLVSVLPMDNGIIPINAITPIVGVPVILYVIINRRKIFYFN